MGPSALLIAAEKDQSEAPAWPRAGGAVLVVVAVALIPTVAFAGDDEAGHDAAGHDMAAHDAARQDELAQVQR
jgi:hypothetical protein